MNDTSILISSDLERRKSSPLDFDPSVYLREDYVILDFETTNLDKGSPTRRDNRIVLACWQVGPTHRSRREYGASVQSHFGNEYEQRRLLADIEAASFIVAHNAKFEVGWLTRAGVEPRDLIVWCTQIGEFVLAGNRRFEGGLSLKSSLRRYGLEGKLSYVRALLESGICPSTIDQGDLGSYCCRDVQSTENLFLRQRRSINSLGLLNVLYGRCLQTPMLADTEQRGVQLDGERVRASYSATIKNNEVLRQELEQGYGQINWASPKQVGRLVYTELGFAEARDYRGNPIRTRGGQASTSEDVISKLAPTTDRQRHFKRLYGELAGLKKEVQYLEAMLGCVNEDNGRLYASFNQTVAQNHRLSSTGGKWGLQFQNQPRHLRSLFQARERDWVVLDGDCPQLEFRVATDLGHDEVARRDILEGIDVHLQTSSVTGFNRQDSKPHTFKPLYGGRSGPPRLRAYYEFFRKKYKAIYDTQMQWVYDVLRYKELRTSSTGLIFYWPDTEVTSSGYITNTPAIFNYPVSMFATADISQLSLLLVWHMLRGMQSFIVNTVHDSGVLEVAPEEVDKVKEIMVHCYTVKIYEVLKQLYDYQFETMLGVGIKVGPHWGEGKEEKYESELFKDRRRLDH